MCLFRVCVCVVAESLQCGAKTQSFSSHQTKSSEVKNELIGAEMRPRGQRSAPLTSHGADTQSPRPQ